MLKLSRLIYRISDRLVVTVLKTHEQAKSTFYRDDKNFDNKFFLEKFQLKLINLRCLTKTINIFQNELKFLVNMSLKENMSWLTKVTL